MNEAVEFGAAPIRPSRPVTSTAVVRGCLVTELVQPVQRLWVRLTNSLELYPQGIMEMQEALVRCTYKRMASNYELLQFIERMQQKLAQLFLEQNLGTCQLIHAAPSPRWPWWVPFSAPPPIAWPSGQLTEEHSKDVCKLTPRGRTSPNVDAAKTGLGFGQQMALLQTIPPQRHSLMSMV